MTSNEDHGDVICMEELGSPAIRFTNVSNNETFAFSLILVKGLVVGFEGESNDAELVVCRLKRSKPVDEFKYCLRCDKFSVLLPLEAGENEFIFCISQFSVKQTYSYDSTARISIVTPVYIICRDENESPDEDPEPNLCAKIVIGCRLIQTLIAESLYQSGYGRKSFSLENSKLAFYLVRLFYRNMFYFYLFFFPKASRMKLDFKDEGKQPSKFSFCPLNLFEILWNEVVSLCPEFLTEN